MHHQPGIDKIFLNVNDPYESKYQYLRKKCEEADLKHFKNTKPFREYSNDIKDIYRSIEVYNSMPLIY